MRRFPYFLGEGVLLLLAAASLAVPFFIPALTSYVLALVCLILFIGVFVTFDRHAKDFSASVSAIRGLGWDTSFLSVGTLDLEFGGEKVRYRSEVVGGGKNIAVDYFLSLDNGNMESFSLTRSPSGELPAEGGFLKSAMKEILAFDSCYPIRRISNSDGRLEICVRLEFERGPPPSKEEKLADMRGFLEDFLSFACLMNRGLKAGKKAK